MAAAETQALFQQLTILLALATASQFLFRRWHLPMIIGEIAVGIVLGPSVVGNAALGSYRYFFDPAVVRTLAVLGSIFLLFLIGLDFDFRVVYTRKNVAVASGGVVLPLLLGFAAALYLVPVASIGANGTQFTMALFVGATLTATSVAITAAVLFELNLLKDRVAQTILGAAVVDDVLGLIVLSVVVGATAGRVSPVDLVILVTEAVGFLVVGMAIGIYLLRRVVARIHIEGKTLGVPLGGFVVAVAITFLFALTAESLGLSAVVGAFLAGSMFANTTLQDDFSKAARPLPAVFTPIFFVSLALQVDFPSVQAGPESRRGGAPGGGRGRPTGGNGAAAWLGDDGLGVGPCGPVREAHKPSRVTSSIGGGTVLSEPDLSDRFKAALLELKAEPHSATGKDSTLEILRSVVEGHRANRVVVANLPAELRAVVSGALQGRSVQFLEDLPSRDVLGACAAAEVGVTWAEYAIAEDGAIVEVAHDDAARLAASLPIVHIVLLPAGRLVRDVGEAMAVVGDILRASGPGKRPTVTFISGPSRTGDIELRLLYGVHGPHSLHVVLLEWFEGR